MADKIDSIIKDSNLIRCISYAKSVGAIKNFPSRSNYENSKEAEEDAKEEICSFLNEKIISLKQDISELRKEGFDVEIEDIKLLEIPLKIKVWRAYCDEIGLKKIYESLLSIESVIKNLKVELEKKISEKEKKEKEKEKEFEIESKKRKEEHEKIIIK